MAKKKDETKIFKKVGFDITFQQHEVRERVKLHFDKENGKPLELTEFEDKVMAFVDSILSDESKKPKS